MFITGVNGQLGHDMMLELHRRGHAVIGSGSGSAYKEEDAVAALPYVSLDITDKQAVHQVLSDVRPDAVVHCSAWTTVDAAEAEENKPKVYALNVIGTSNIASACREMDVKLLYLSTDYVFSGQGTVPWQPDCIDFSPLNYYGLTKLEGEKTVRTALEKYYIVRIAWVFGKNGKNFIKTMLDVGKTYDSVRVVTDQIGTPTYTADLSVLLSDMLESDKYGTYHATNEGGFISWYDFCCEIYRQAGLSTKVVPVTTAEYGLLAAARPFNSRLDKTKLAANGFSLLPSWQNALHRYLIEIGEIKK